MAVIVETLALSTMAANDLLAPLLPGMEQPPHPMRLGDDEKDYYLREPVPGRAAEPVVGEQV